MVPIKSITLHKLALRRGAFKKFDLATRAIKRYREK
jgi:hypothetical protein